MSVACYGKLTDFWHDRAAFHFLTDEEEITSYIKTVSQSIQPNGILLMGTFSVNGPQKCSGIEIKQYSEQTLINCLRSNFEPIKCINVDHLTPFQTVQNFVFCCFRRNKD